VRFEKRSAPTSAYVTNPRKIIGVLFQSAEAARRCLPC
jgi:hypothetical protein